MTLALALVAASARATIPYLTQRVTDEGLLAPGGVNVDKVHWLVAGGAVVVVISMLVEWRVRRRMVIAAEAGLATLRKRAFGNVHRLSVLTQNSEQRGRYVSRVTGDVDTMRDLMQWEGAGMVVAALESTVVFVVMALYSWQLALVVVACYVPLLVVTLQDPARDPAYLLRRSSAHGGPAGSHLRAVGGRGDDSLLRRAGAHAVAPASRRSTASRARSGGRRGWRRRASR